MSKIVSDALRRALKEVGISIVREGTIPIPTDGIEITKGACRKAGMVERRPAFLFSSILWGITRSDLFFDSDTLVSFKGRVGLLTWKFTRDVNCNKDGRIWHSREEVDTSDVIGLYLGGAA